MRVLVVFPIEFEIDPRLGYDTAIVRALETECSVDDATRQWSAMVLETQLVPIDRAIARWAHSVHLGVAVESGTVPKRVPPQCRKTMWGTMASHLTVKSHDELIQGVDKVIVFARSRVADDPYNMVASRATNAGKLVSRHVLAVVAGKIVVV